MQKQNSNKQRNSQAPSLPPQPPQPQPQSQPQFQSQSQAQPSMLKKPFTPEEEEILKNFYQQPFFFVPPPTGQEISSTQYRENFQSFIQKFNAGYQLFGRKFALDGQEIINNGILLPIKNSQNEPNHNEPPNLDQPEIPLVQPSQRFPHSPPYNPLNPHPHPPQPNPHPNPNLNQNQNYPQIHNPSNQYIKIKVYNLKFIGYTLFTCMMDGLKTLRRESFQIEKLKNSQSLLKRKIQEFYMLANQIKEDYMRMEVLHKLEEEIRYLDRERGKIEGKLGKIWEYVGKETGVIEIDKHNQKQQQQKQQIKQKQPQKQKQKQQQKQKQPQNKNQQKMQQQSPKQNHIQTLSQEEQKLQKIYLQIQKQISLLNSNTNSNPNPIIQKQHQQQQQKQQQQQQQQNSKMLQQKQQQNYRHISQLNLTPSTNAYSNFNLNSNQLSHIFQQFSNGKWQIQGDCSEPYKGTLKFFNKEKNYGFIRVDDAKIDIFAALIDFQRAGVSKDVLDNYKFRECPMRFSFKVKRRIGKQEPNRRVHNMTKIQSIPIKNSNFIKKPY